MVLCISCAPKRDRPDIMALPIDIDPRKLALQGYCLEGEVAVGGLPRLVSSVLRICGPVLASVQFELDETKARIAKGSAKASVEVVCQRCLDPVQIDPVFMLSSRSRLLGQKSRSRGSLKIMSLG